MGMAKKGKGNSIGLYIIVGLICFAMIGFGATNFGGTVSSIGQVGEREISAQRYYAALLNRSRQIQQQTGQPFTFAQMQALGLDQAALQELIATVALESEAGTLGISAGDEVVAEEILAIPGFRGLNGQFDRETYRLALNRNNMTERQFEDDLRAEIASTLLQGAVVTAVAAPEPYMDALMQFIGERRSFTWGVLDEAALTAELPTPSDADLRAYFAANEAAFMLPETRAITYAWLTPEMLLDQVALDEADIRALYESRANEFNVPERRLVERLILGADAADAKARLDAGEITFEDLVAERDLNLADIDLGDVTEADLDDAGADIFAAELGVVGPLPTPLGDALFRVNAVLAAQVTSFEDARAGLEEELGLIEAEALVGDQIDVVDDLLAGGATVEEVAAETEAELGTIDWSVDSTGGIADFVAFNRAAAAVTEDDFPEVRQLEGGGLFAMRLDGTTAPRLAAFDDVRAEAEAGWRAEAVIEALTEQAGPIVVALEAGGAVPTGFETQTQAPVTRDAFVPGTTPDLMLQAFEMTPGEVRIIPTIGAVQIIRLDEVLGPDAADDTIEQRRNALELATRQLLGTDILGAFAGAVQADTGISLDQAAIQAVHVNLP
jgi:peptidyl-prolyl cis-trans isomerase D